MQPDPPTVKPLMVDAQTARYYLTTIGAQRALRPLYVEQLAQAMVRGEWSWNNDVVAFTGKLRKPNCRQVNGMHRSYAVVRADELAPGITVPLLIGDGYHPDAPPNFDLGHMRTLADTLDFLEGRAEQPGHRDLAAVANLAWHVSAGTWANRMPPATRVQVLDFMKANPDLLDAIEPARMVNRGIGGGGIAGYGVAVWLMSHGKHVGRVDEYLTAVATGEMLRASDPAYVTREGIRKAREAGHVAGERSVRGWWVAAIVVEGWNAYIAGEKRQSVRHFRRTDTFPEAV